MSTTVKGSHLKNITVENGMVSINYEESSSDTYYLKDFNRLKIELSPTIYVSSESSEIKADTPSGGGSGGGSGSGGDSYVTNLYHGWYNNNYKVDAAIDDYVVHHYNFGSQTVTSNVKKLTI